MSAAHIHVRFAVHGLHCWPQAPERRAYLRALHRHLFFVEVSTAVEHDDREIEFHDLQEEAAGIFRMFHAASRSCEMMARELAQTLATTHGRAFTVTVWEDNECGATVEARR